MIRDDPSESELIQVDPTRLLYLPWFYTWE